MSLRTSRSAAHGGPPATDRTRQALRGALLAFVQAIDPSLHDRVERVAAALSVHAAATTTSAARLP